MTRCIFLGSPVGSDDFVKRRFIWKSAKVDMVLTTVADMGNAQIAIGRIVVFSCPSFISSRSLGARRRTRRSKPLQF
jgi:hypothetical protein